MSDTPKCTCGISRAMNTKLKCTCGTCATCKRRDIDRRYNRRKRTGKVGRVVALDDPDHADAFQGTFEKMRMQLTPEDVLGLSGTAHRPE